MEPGSQRQAYAERSASFIGFLLFAGRMLERAGAFGQVLLIAAVLGSTTRADLYFMASIVPLTLGNVVGEALGAVILPRASREEDPTAVQRLFAAGFWIAAGVLTALTVLYVAAVAVIVPQATPAGTASLLPWLAFAPVGIFFGLGTFCAAPLLHYERYVWPALRGASATIVALGLSGLAVALGGGVVWIGLAVSAGYGTAFVLLALELVSIGRVRVFAPPSRRPLRDVLGLWRKVLASASSGIVGGQVFVLIERLLTAPLGVGAVASISYARGVAFTPSALGQAISAGLYPSLLRAHAAEAGEYVRQRFVSGLRLTLFVTVVSGSFLAIYSAEIADALFGRDAVTRSSLTAVQQCLLAFSLALLGWMLTIYSSRMFGALNLFRGVLIQELIALAVYLAIVFPLRGGLGVPGVALAFAIGQVLGGAVSIVMIARRLTLPARAIVTEAVLPTLVRAAPVVLALAAIQWALGESTGASAPLVALSGALITALAAGASLWSADWPELESARAFVRRSRRRSAPRQ
jgi:peptidoglycan biosynthesis protein MviN/MurJ (putative lipid II flippase)